MPLPPLDALCLPDQSAEERTGGIVCAMVAQAYWMEGRERREMGVGEPVPFDGDMWVAEDGRRPARVRFSFGAEESNLNLISIA